MEEFEADEARERLTHFETLMTPKQVNIRFTPDAFRVLESVAWREGKPVPDMCEQIVVGHLVQDAGVFEQWRSGELVLDLRKETLDDQEVKVEDVSDTVPVPRKLLQDFVDAVSEYESSIGETVDALRDKAASKAAQARSEIAQSRQDRALRDLLVFLRYGCGIAAKTGSRNK